MKQIGGKAPSMMNPLADLMSSPQDQLYLPPKPDSNISCRGVGVEISLETPVAKLLVSGGKAVGVQLVSGEEIAATTDRKSVV